MPQFWRTGSETILAPVPTEGLTILSAPAGRIGGLVGHGESRWRDRARLENQQLRRDAIRGFPPARSWLLPLPP
jgi:hypothetical protein